MINLLLKTILYKKMKNNYNKQLFIKGALYLIRKYRNI